MIGEKQIINCIKELNIAFKKRDWKLLPENNKYAAGEVRYFNVIHMDNSLYLHRCYIPYEKHLNKYTFKELDQYVVDLIKDICLKYGIVGIVFGNYDTNHYFSSYSKEDNTIDINK